MKNACRFTIRLCLALGLIASVSCSTQKTKKDDAAPTGSGFSLTVPEDARANSKFCGDVRPPTPEDPTPAYRFEVDFLNEKLGGDGLLGWMHGVVNAYQQYVFTYRKEDPDDFMAFFLAEQFSLIPADDTVAAALKTMHRHDKVRLKGKVFDNGAPLKHLMITAVEMVEPFKGATENHYDFDLSVLQGHKTFDVFGIVHATVDAPGIGRALIVEHKDLIMPLAVPPSLADAAAPIYRGDVVNVAVKVVEHEHGPPHFEVDEAAAKPIDIVDPLLNCHGMETTVTGYLAKFEKSPAIMMDTYAVRVVDANGVARNFTFFPDEEDPAKAGALLRLIGKKAAAAWNDAAAAPVVVRNFWKKEGLKVTAKGWINVVSTEQANPQVYLKSVDDLTITAAP